MASCRIAARLIVTGLLVLTACSHSDTDDLTRARQRLRTVPCGASPSVTAVAGVNDAPDHVYVGDWVVISVCHLDKFLDAANAVQAPITMTMEGMDTGNQPVGVDVQSGTLTFILDRHQQNRDLWRPFLYNPLFDREVRMRVSVGIRGERPLPRTPGANMQIMLSKIYTDWTTFLWLAFLLVFVIVMIVCARYTDVLREGAPIDGVRQPYSLGRSQMAWWFQLVVLSYSFIWLVTEDQDTIPASILGLIGISSATALAAAVITPSQTGPRRSQGFWRDLVAGDNGAVTLDRLQIVVWTFVLTGIFLYSVIWELTMPEFSATMLALMGVSSGTYIGFQLPQASNPPTASTKPEQ